MRGFGELPVRLPVCPSVCLSACLPVGLIACLSESLSSTPFDGEREDGGQPGTAGPFEG